jgi:hypothetical protein
MTDRATFGDFAATATRQLRDLQMRSVEQVGSVAGVRAVMHTMAGYVNDVCTVFDAANPMDRSEMGPWIRASARAQHALGNLQPDPDADFQSDRDWPASVRADGLRGAVMSMTLGRDLLHTHVDIRAETVTEHRSEWAAVICSPPVARAILHQIGDWARHLNSYAGRAARSSSGRDRHSLHAACQGLFAVSCAIAIAQEQRHARADELRLLASIPMNAQPLAALPAADETVARLCDGVIDTAERLRFAARRSSPRAAWSQDLTRESLRQTAGCCAITASNLQITLSTLAAHHGRPCAPYSALLADAAAAADRARAAWLRVAQAWDSITTDTRGSVSPTATDAASLALWTGRLAYTDPDWTPVLGPRHQPRPSTELAVDYNGLRQLVDAAHHACHSMAVVADSEQRQVRVASMAGRLMVPTRSLPESFDVPYRFAPAPGTHVEPLISSYDLALHASKEATAAVADIAAEVKAPSQLMTTARAVAGVAGQTPPDAEPCGFQHRPAGTKRARQEHVNLVVQGEPPQPQPIPPGPVERILLDLDVTSPADLKQAAALDTAADQLILRAATAARRSPVVRDPSRSAGSAELINRLLITTDGDGPGALAPGQPHGSPPGNQARRATTHPLALEAEAEAGA